MGHIDFVKLLSQLASLTQLQREQVRSALDERPSTSNSAIARVIPNPNVCPHCQAPRELLRAYP